MYFFNQILAALVLTAALVGGINAAAQTVFPAPGPEKIVYPIETLAAAPAPAETPVETIMIASAEPSLVASAEPIVVASVKAAAAPATAQTAPVGFAALIAAADPAAGEKQAGLCKACHSLDKGGAAKLGPNLWGVVGRAKGSVAGFAYSPAISSVGGSWTYDDLDRFLENPMAFAKGTKMAFAGVKKPEQRAAIIAYLRRQADSPAPLPK